MKKNRNKWLLSLFYIYVIILTGIILLKTQGFHILNSLDHWTIENFHYSLLNANWLPLKTISHYSHLLVTQSGTLFYIAFYNLVGNVLLFMPMGFLMPFIVEEHRFFKVMIISFLISCSLELIQLVTLLGCFDVDDMILNVLGAILGYLCFWILTMNKTPKTKKTSLVDDHF